MKARLVKAGCYEVSVGRQRYWVERYPEGWGWCDPDQPTKHKYGVFKTKNEAVKAIGEWITSGRAKSY